MSKSSRLLTSGFLAALWASAAGAQTREEIVRKPLAPVPSSTAQSISVNDGIERAPCPLASAEFADVKLALSGAEFRNLKGISPDLLKPAWQVYVGKTIPLSTVCEIRDYAATILRQKGYLAAVQIPPQKIESGSVKFDVLVAKIVDFQVRGNAGKAEGLISGYLSEIKGQEAFNILEAERYLLLARDIPGYDVRLTLRPAGTVPGEVIGEVLVSYTPVEAELNVQNFGSRETGRFGGLAQIHYNGLIGAGDRSSLGYFATADFKEQHVVQANEQVRIGREGLTLSGDFIYAWTRPSIDPTLDLRSNTWTASLEARYPLVRRQSRNFSIAGGFDAINQRVRLGTAPVSIDKLRVAYIRADYDSIDAGSIGSVAGYSASEPMWRLGGGVELRQGLNILGNSEGCGIAFANCTQTRSLSRLEADTTAFVARANLNIEMRPLPLIGIVVAARGQYAPHPLLSYEEFSGGNFTVGRGYDPGTVTGDSGVGLTTELRYGSLVPSSTKDLAWQLYAFTDSAWVWNKDIAALPNDPQRLVSTGGGVRMTYGDRFSIDMGGAVPLRSAGILAEKPDVRFLVNLTVKLLPWKRR